MRSWILIYEYEYEYREVRLEQTSEEKFGILNKKEFSDTAQY